MTAAAELPPDGSVLALPRGRFRAIIVRPVGDRLQLRGWYLDEDYIHEETVTVAADRVTVLSTS